MARPMGMAEDEEAGKAHGEAVPELDLVRLYLDELGSHALLDRDDEVRLAQLIDAGHVAERALSAGTGLTRAERRGLTHRSDRGGRGREKERAAH